MGTVAIIAAALLAGGLIGAFVVGLASAAAKPTPCSTCNSDRVIVYAGDLARDEGYCELRRCPSCSDGTRLGRSDHPIVTDDSEVGAHKLRRIG